MSTIFSKIISGDLPAYRIFEDENYIVILDIFPISYGHVLVIPKDEKVSWLEMSEHQFSELQRLAHKIGLALQKAIGCEKVGMMIDGREVPHIHVHLIPIVEGKKLNEKSIEKPTDQEFKDLAEKITNAFESSL
jgi:histidine triad (HIT) family protein